MQDDLTDAVQRAVDQGIADPKRVAIYGGSYGTHLTGSYGTYSTGSYAACCWLLLALTVRIVRALTQLATGSYWLLWYV